MSVAEVRAALTGRRELALLDEPSVLAVGVLLTRRCRDPQPWVRAAVTTLDRFGREVAGGDLSGLLERGHTDARVATASLDALARRHDGLGAAQLALLGFGPRLWWTVGGVDVPWRPLPGGMPGQVPLPGARSDPDVRLLLLALIGTGATLTELIGVRVRDAGRLDAAGRLVPDLDAEPLAVSYRPDGPGPSRVTFLSYDARRALQERIASRGEPGPDEPLLLPAGGLQRAAAAADRLSGSLIEAGNDVNVLLCRTTGEFFRTWGLPGARYDARTHDLTEEHS